MWAPGAPGPPWWKSPLQGVSIAQVNDDYGENTRRLIDEGVIPGPPPQPYGQVIEDLDPDEIEALISIKEKLDKASEKLGESGEGAFIGMVIPL